MKSLKAILVKDGLTEHSFPGITPSPKAEKCHPCVRYKLSPMCQAAQKSSILAVRLIQSKKTSARSRRRSSYDEFWFNRNCLGIRHFSWSVDPL